MSKRLTWLGSFGNRARKAWSTSCSLVLAATLSSCNSNRLEFSFEGNSQDYGTAIVAASEWNRACPDVWVQVTRGGDGIPMRVVPANSLLSVGWAGVTRFDDGAVEQIEVDAAYAYRSVFAHEIGHALGLEHKAQGVMRSAADLDAHVTAGDCPE